MKLPALLLALVLFAACRTVLDVEYCEVGVAWTHVDTLATGTVETVKDSIRTTRCTDPRLNGRVIRYP